MKAILLLFAFLIYNPVFSQENVDTSLYGNYTFKCACYLKNLIVLEVERVRDSTVKPWPIRYIFDKDTNLVENQKRLKKGDVMRLKPNLHKESGVNYIVGNIIFSFKANDGSWIDISMENTIYTNEDLTIGYLVKKKCKNKTAKVVKKKKK